VVCSPARPSTTIDRHAVRGLKKQTAGNARRFQSLGNTPLR
jgi:hypothetical protein